MEYRLVGATGWRISALGLGTLSWGRGTSLESAGALVTTLLDAGGSLLEVSQWRGESDVEEVVGTLLEHAFARTEVQLNVVGGLRHHRGGTLRDLSRANLLSSLDASMERLGVDHVDLFTVCGPDGTTPWTEVAAGLAQVVRSGRARYVGIAGAAPWQVARLGSLLQGEGITMAVAETELSLVVPSRVNTPIQQAAAEVGAGLIGWAPLARGVLSGRYRHTIPADSRAADPTFAPWVEPYLGDAYRGVIDAAATAAQGLRTSPSAIALAWTLHHSDAASVIVGPRTPQQLSSLIDAMTVQLPDAVAGALDEVNAQMPDPA